MRVLSKGKAGWLELRRRLARWIDPLDWDELLTPRTRVKVAESEIGLWLTTAEYEELEGALAEGPIELTPAQQARADAFRDELLAVISHHRAQRIRETRLQRSRRVALAVSGVLLSLLALHSTTREGPLDALLRTGDRSAERRTGVAFENRYPQSMSAEPKLESATEPLIVPWRAGRTARAIAYMSEGGSLCSSFQMPAKKRVGAPFVRGCRPFAGLLIQLSDRRPALLSGISAAEWTVVRGFTTSEVETIGVTGPYGAMQVWMTDVWTPDTDDTAPIRFFVALGERPAGQKLNFQDWDVVLDRRNYRIKAQLDDGQSVVIEGHHYHALRRLVPRALG
jgi:hypothetical protein